MSLFILLRFLLAGVLHTNASILFSGGTVIAFDDTASGLQILRNGSVLVEDDRVTNVFEGDESSQISIPQGTEIFNISGKIITPGFMDAHHHLWQSLFKTLESNDSLATYCDLFGETGPAEKYFTLEDSYISNLASALESLNAGVTTIVDHAHGLWSNATADAILRADIDSGARVFFGFAMHHLTNNWTIQDQMQKFSAMVEAGLYKNTSTSLGIAYDFFYSDPPELVSSIIDLAQRSKVPFITSHYVRGPFLVDNSPEVLAHYGILNTSIPIILSHSSYITARGRDLLPETNQYIATTPESELQLLFDTHNLTKLIQDQAALGIDTNFGFTADLLTQSRIWLQRLRGLNANPVAMQNLYPSTSPMSVDQAFLLATRHGGLALHRPDLGIIAPGAKADLVIFDTSSPSLLGWNDPVAAVIMHAGIGDIEALLVDGKFVKRDGRLTYEDYDRVREKFAQSAARIQKVWAETPQPDFDGMRSANVTEYAVTEEIDTLRGEGMGYGSLEVQA